MYLRRITEINMAVRLNRVLDTYSAPTFVREFLSQSGEDSNPCLESSKGSFIMDVFRGDLEVSESVVDLGSSQKIEPKFCVKE